MIMIFIIDDSKAGIIACLVACIINLIRYRPLLLLSIVCPVSGGL